MTILLASCIGPAERWVKPLRSALPKEIIYLDTDEYDPKLIEVALFSNKAPGTLKPLTNLKLIIALQAGVEDLLTDPDLPYNIPIVRSSSPVGDPMIAEYVLLHVLRHHRQMPFFIENQRQLIWEKPDVLQASERRIGFMGMGLIAGACADLVKTVGFEVSSWTRTPNRRPNIQNFFGGLQLESFLHSVDILVNILPLTKHTKNILNKDKLKMLPRGSSIINIGRGQHIVDKDLIETLDAGHLTGATLDVFRQEPLPSNHPFWRHPKITLMPHTARKTRPTDIIPQIKENIRRLRAKEQLLQLVNIDAGY
jgi:glyoxylate/hydroxypyruvate reductase A